MRTAIKVVMMLLISLGVMALYSSPLQAFTGKGGEGCSEGTCSDCHSLNVKEASGLLEGFVEKVDQVDFSEVPGLWVVHAESKGRKGLLYMDFSKKYVISGQILKISNRENITRKKINELVKVDPAVIPLSDALLLGRREAKHRVIVFTDPQCPYCKKLHPELVKAVEMDPDVAFFLKLYPLVSIHPDSARISRSIVCSKSIEMLEDSFSGKPTPDPTCETDAVENTRKLAKELGINSTPTMILPDGRVATGVMKAEDILKLIYKKD